MAYLFIAISIVILYWRAHTFRPQGIASLTSLRAFAAAIVFAVHFNKQYLLEYPGLLSKLTRGGIEGVNVFFVLSGFLLTVTLARDLKSGSFSVRQYFIRRVARIYPLYFALLFGVFLFAPDSVHPQNLFLLQGFYPSIVFSGIPTAWTLSVEECFYALLPIVLVSCLKLKPRIALPLWSAILLTAGLLVVALQIPFVLGSAQFAFALSIFGRFPIFAAGIACAFLYERKKQYSAALLIGSSALLFVIMWATAFEEYAPPFRITDYTAALAVGGIVLGLASDNRLTRFLGNRYFAYLGAISYALYLLQLTPMLSWLVPLTHSLPDLVAAYAIVTLCAMVCYELIERPARAYILQRVGRKTPESVVLPVQALSGNKPDAF